MAMEMRRMTPFKEKISIFSGASVMVSLIVAVLSWTFFTPPFSAVDGPAHTSAAYASVHGQLVADTNIHQPKGYVTSIKVPNWIFPIQATEGPYCFWGKREISASCANNNWDDSTIQERPNQYAQYFPTYSVIAGIPSLFTSGKTAYYLMSISGALLFFIMCWIYFVSCARRGKPKQILGIFVILTPMSISGAGMLAPLSLETIAAACFLSLLINRLREEQSDNAFKKIDTYLLTFSLFVLLTSRPSGVLWVFFAFIFAIPFINGNYLDLIKREVALMSTAGFLILFDLVYLYFHRPETGSNPLVGSFSILNFLSFEFQKLGESFNNAVGIFGMDVYLPSVFYYLFAGIIFSVLVLVFTSNEVEKKIKTIVAIGIVAVVILPMIVAFTYRYDFVGFGQGRYYNPLLGMLMLISIIAIEKNTLVFAFSLISLGASLMGVLIAFWRSPFHFLRSFQQDISYSANRIIRGS
jgi:hypothetical protein